MQVQSSLKKLEDIYNNYLQNVASIDFTPREIDVMCCILFNKSDKKIASILDISYRTVGTHARNIMHKLGYNTKERIIDFIEKSGKQKYFHRYYYQILLHSKIRDTLRKIGATINTQEKEYSVYFDKNSSDELRLFLDLQSDLALAGISLKKATTGVKSPAPVLNATENKDYSTLCLELAQNSIEKSDLSGVIDQFNNEIGLLEDSLATINSVAKSDTIKAPTKLWTKYIIIFALITGLAIAISTQVPALKNYALTLTQSSNVIRHNLPRGIDYFVNHKIEIKDLRKKLIQQGTVGITGITGKGKTVLATKYANEYKSDYDIIAHFNGDIDLLTQYIAFAKKVNSTICNDGSCHISLHPSKVVDELKAFFSARKKWLIIFDNLQVNQNQKIKDMLEWENSGHMIVTTQDNRFIDHKLELSYFNQQDTNIMVGKINNKIPDDIRDKIFKATNGHPYLIARIASFIDNYRHKNVDEILDSIITSKDPADSYIELLLDNISADSKKILHRIMLVNNQKISKKYLHKISGLEKKDFDTSLDELIMLSILEQTNDDISDPRFAVHDVLAKKLLKKASKKEIKTHIDDMLDITAEMLPYRSMAERYNVIAGDDSLLGCAEKLLINSDLYKTDMYKGMKLRKYMLDYYIGIIDRKNCDNLSNWLLSKEKDLDTKNMDSDQIDVFAYYMIKIGFAKYEMAEQNYHKAIKYYNNAIALSSSTNKIVSKFVSRYQLASALTTIGETAQAKKLLADLPQIDKSIENKFHYFQARIEFTEGDFNNALALSNDAINIYIKQNDSKTSVFYALNILKAEILNYLGSYQESYKLASQLNDTKKYHLANCDVISGKVLTHLAWAEYGLKKQKSAHDHVDKAINFLLKSIGDTPLTKSNSKELADAYVVKGNCLRQEGQLQEAKKSYDKAQIIYANLYQDRASNVSFVKRLRAEQSQLNQIMKK